MRDDEASWPDYDKMNLEGLVYDDLKLHDNPTQEQVDQSTITKPLPLEVGKRIAWLRAPTSKAEIRPQPWVQLSRYLESINNKVAAKRVLFEFRSLQAHRAGGLSASP